MQTVFLTYYGIGQISQQRQDWQQSQDRLNASALSFGEVTRCEAWNDQRLKATEFYSENQGILQHSRGAGYWLWKPYIILETLQNLNQGDVVIYHDVGRPGSDSARTYAIETSLRPIVDFCINNGGMLPGVYNAAYKNRRWIKRDCFVLMECDSKMYWDATHVSASFSAWQVCDKAIGFVAEWLNYCTDPRILTDQPNTLGRPDLEGYESHRHDQAVLSNLVVKLDAPCYGSDRSTIYRFRDINFLAKRIRNDIALQVDRPRLKEIAWRYGCDKYHNRFTGTYQNLMEAFRDTPVKLLEIGTDALSAVRMWRSYFGQGEYHYINIDSPDSDISNATPGVGVTVDGLCKHVLDASNRIKLEQLVKSLQGTAVEFDFIIDSGNHLMQEQQVWLGILFPMLKPGGTYVIEGIESSHTEQPAADVFEDASNTTLGMFRNFHRRKSMQSIYLSQQENIYFNDNVRDIGTFWHCNGARGITAIIKKQKPV